MNDRRGVVAVILAGSVGISLVILTAGAAWAIVDKALTVPTAVASLLSTGFGAFIGAVATYLGTWRPGGTEPPVESPASPGESE